MTEQSAPVLPPGWTVAPMIPEHDLDGVLLVEAASFVNHWTREMFEWEIRNSDVAHVFVLREPGGRVAGYCAVWLIFDELHINNLALLPEYRGRQLGAALLAWVLEESARRGATRATLEVRASNVVARRLYERFGFAVAAVRRAYYSNPDEDAVVMWRAPEEATDS